MTILRAQPEDHQVLTEIAHAAKRHWGYPESWIEEWRYFLTVLPEDIANNHGFIGVVDGRLIGPVSDTTQAVVAQAMNEWQRVALLLGSPEFQKK